MLDWMQDPADARHWQARGDAVAYDIRQYSTLDYTLSWSNQRRRCITMKEALDVAENAEHPPAVMQPTPMPGPTSVPCPTCGAEVNAVCKTGAGIRTRNIHGTRVHIYHKGLVAWYAANPSSNQVPRAEPRIKRPWPTGTEGCSQVG